MPQAPHTTLILAVHGPRPALHPLMRCLALQTSGLTQCEIMVVRSGAGPSLPNNLDRWSAILRCRDFRCLESPEADALPLLFNAGAAAARSGLLLFLRPEHRPLPAYLECCLARIAAGADAAYTDRVLVNGNLLSCRRLPEYDPVLLRTANPLGEVALWTRSAFEDADGFSARAGFPEWELWIRAAQTGHFGERVPRPLLSRAVLDGSTAANETAPGRQEALLVARNHAFFAPEVLRWALALLRGERWARPLGFGRIPDVRQVRLLLAGAPPIQGVPLQPAAPDLDLDAAQQPAVSA